MDGIIYLLNLTGQALAQANARIAELEAQLEHAAAKLRAATEPVSHGG